MSKPAVFQADFADFRQVKSRKVAQLIMEIPLEKLREAMDTLGWPAPETSLPVAIARLNLAAGERPPSAETPLPQQAPAEPAQQPKKHFRDMPRSQQAALKCQDITFAAWLLRQAGNPDAIDQSPQLDLVDRALKSQLRIVSKRDLDTDKDAGERFDRMLATFDCRGLVR